MFEESDLSELIAEFGNRYINEGQTRASIHKQLFEPGGLKADFRPIPTVNDVYKGGYASVDEVLQAFGVEFTTKGKATFKPTQQRLGQFKIDTTEVPDVFRPSWAGFLSQHATDPDRSRWGVIEYILRELKIPRANEDFVFKVAYYGWQFEGYAAIPTVNGTTLERQLKSDSAAHLANASMDGVRTQIVRWNAAGRTINISVGAWNADDELFVKQIEDFVWDDSVNLLRNSIDNLYMSEAMHRRYRAGKRKMYNTNYLQEADLDSIRDTQIKVKGVPEMTGAGGVWMTTPRNRVNPRKGKAKPMFNLQLIDRKVKMLADWEEVLTFDVPEFIVHSEHDTTISAGLITSLYTEA